MILKVKQSKKRVKISYLWITFAAILFNIGLQGFLQEAKILSSGLTAIAALPTFLWSGLTDYVSLIMLAMNVPLIIFFWNKNRRKFMIRTMYFLVINAAIGSLFLIPEVKAQFNDLLHYNKFSGTWREDGWPILFMAGIGSILMGSGIALTWKYGGSTGGTDIVTYYYSTKKKKSIGTLSTVIALFFVAFSFITVIIVKKDMRDYWLLTLVASIAYSVIVGICINVIYPKYSKVEITIVSEKTEEISKKLHERKFRHSWRIAEYISGYNNQKKKEIRTVTYLLESKDLIRFIHQIDPGAWISMVQVTRVDGTLNSDTVDDVE